MRQPGRPTRMLAAGAFGLGLATFPGGPATAVSLACRVEPTVTTSAAAFTLDLTIRNTGGTVIDGWTLHFPLADGQTVTAVRNAAYRPLAGALVAVNVAINRVVEPGAGVDVGFTVAHLGDGTPPAAFRVNGVPCAVG